uniref:TauD/TfdA family dioxygenase n=1 Tax=Streptomyces sp. NBC_00008 TaxID=2903610 RepID=A0AAU2VLB4_9ACTN
MDVQKQEIGSRIDAAPRERLANVNTAKVRELLRENGWVYFTGFSPTMEEYQTFTQRFGKCATPRSIIYPPGGVALGFHAEDSYNPWRPEALWFLCLRAGSDGGAPTGVVDGVGLLDAMDQMWRDFCLAHRLRFDRSWSREEWQKIAHGEDETEARAFLDSLPDFAYDFLPDGTLRTAYLTPLAVTTQAGDRSLSNTALHAVTDPDYYGMVLDNGEPVPQGLLDHIEELALQREIPLGWNDGDMVVIDNYRLMHRRAEYHGNDRELRVVHGEEFFGTTLPVAATPVAEALKEALQGEEELR